MVCSKNNYRLDVGHLVVFKMIIIIHPATLANRKTLTYQTSDFTSSIPDKTTYCFLSNLWSSYSTYYTWSKKTYTIKFTHGVLLIQLFTHRNGSFKPGSYEVHWRQSS